MTNEQINIAIAKQLGLTIVSDGITHCLTPCGPKTEKDPEGCLLEECPNYCNNLNAMRDAWLSLSEEDKFVFDKELQRIILRAKDGQYWLTNATALQRAEAFLRVFGKWEE